MPVIRYNFRKIKRAHLEESSKILILAPKMHHLLHSGRNKHFPQKCKTVMKNMRAIQLLLENRPQHLG